MRSPRLAKTLISLVVVGGGIAGCAMLDRGSRAGIEGGDVGSYGIAERYGEAADRIVRASLAGNQAYERLEHLCIRFGHRLSGSDALDKAIDWAVETMTRDGHDNVRREKVMVPHWVRGQESVTMIEPRIEKLEMLGLGGSVATPPEGITAPVIVVADEEELEAIGERVRGKIVLFNKIMPDYDPEHGSRYGTTVKYRVHGARLAAQHGAVASLIRSVTATSLNTPHTGTMRYGDATTKIPAAALTIEGAETITRLLKHGVPVVLNLKMEAKTLPDAESANVVAELRGSTWPEEVIVIGGHFDSWDVGHGAHDDGGGCIVAMEAINVLRKLNMIPRRTIRVVLWTNEENGLRGGHAYAKDHAGELANHVAAIELDSGVFRPTGFGLSCKNKDREKIAAAQLQEMLDLLAPSLSGLKSKIGGGGADINPLRDSGVVLMGHRVEGSKYFDYHHTAADTIDKIDPLELDQNVAVLATIAYILADMPHRVGELPNH